MKLYCTKSEAEGIGRRIARMLLPLSNITTVKVESTAYAVGGVVYCGTIVNCMHLFCSHLLYHDFNTIGKICAYSAAH